MPNYLSQLALAENLLSVYKPGVPLNQFLKSYFKQHKKHGSKDRKLITALCFDFFRLGFAQKNVATGERILNGFFLCEHAPSPLLELLKPSWNDLITKPLLEKWEIVNTLSHSQEQITSIFSYKDELSDPIDAVQLSLSLLIQPKLYLRIRPGFSSVVLRKLQANNISYEVVAANTIALPNASNIAAIIDLDKEAVVQDLNSQRVGELMKLALDAAKQETKRKPDVWDCCAASGGKSIMAHDIEPTITLTVSDKRKPILENLKSRFAKAAIQNYHSFTADLSGTGVPLKEGAGYDLIIADVPCSGSGTWARTPEQLYYSDQTQIKKYSDLQKQILTNVLPSLNRRGYLLYITCSVFKQENEAVVDYIKEHLGLRLIKTELLIGYEIQADTMFVALFQHVE